MSDQDETAVGRDPTTALGAGGGGDVGGGPPPTPARNGPDRWLIALIVAVVVMIVLLAAVLLTGDDEAEVATEATTTTTETTAATSTTTTSESTTTTSEPTTTTSIASPPVTVDPVRCDGNKPATMPEAAAQVLYDAWTVGDRGCAEGVADDDAVDTLFATSGVGNDWTFQGCFEEDEPDPHHDCAYTYPGGSAHFLMNYGAVGGWNIYDVSFVAD